MDNRIEYIVMLLDSDRSAIFTSNELAKRVNLSTSYLQHLFKREKGEPLQKYVKDRKLEMAKSLLCNTLLSVKEIMTKVGFADISHFVRDFKKAFGKTPSEYRKIASTNVHILLDLAESANK